MPPQPFAGPPAPFPPRPGVAFRALAPALWQAAAVFVALLLVTTLLVALLDVAGSDPGKAGDLGDWLGVAMLLIGLGAGGSATGTITSEYVDATASLHAMPWLVTLGLLGSVVLLARRTERRRPAASTGVLFGRAGIHAGLLALLITLGGLLAGVTRPTDDGQVKVGLNVALTLLLSLVVIFGASLLAQLTVRRGPLAPAGRDLLDAVSLATRICLMLLVVALLIGPLTLLGHALACIGNSCAATPYTDWRTVLVAVILALPTGALLMTGTSVSGSATGELTGVATRVLDDTSGSGEASWGLLTDPGRFTPLLLVPLFVIVLAAVRHTVRRSPGQWRGRVHPGTVGAVTGVVTLAFVLAALSQRVSLSVSADATLAGGSGGVTAGPSLLGAILAGLIWGVLAGLMLRWAPSFAFAVPRLTRWSGRVHPAWREVLAGRAWAPPGILHPRPAKWTLAVAGGLAVLLAAAAGAHAWIETASYSPAQAARDYLGAVGDGDAKKALGLLASPPEDTALLTDDVLKASGVQRPRDIRLKKSKIDGDDATVEVDFHLGDAAHHMTLELHADPDDEKWGMSQWRVAGDLGTFRNPYLDGGYEPSIAGHKVAGEVALFPGRYPVQVTDASGLFTVDPAEVAVLDGAADFDPPASKVSATGEEKIAGAVRAKLQECTASSYGYGCPFSAYDVPSYISSGLSVQFRLVKQPKIVVRLTDQEIVADVTGEVAYTEKKYTGPDETGTLPLSTTASVTLTESGAVTVTFP